MSFNVTLQPSGHTFEADPARNILRSGLEAGFNLPYSCRASGCATCKARIVSGKIDHGASSETYMPPSMRAEGYALLCQAKKRRSYSIALPPVLEGGMMDLELHVRHTPGGFFTDRVFGGLKVGDLLRFEGPLGTFYLREDSTKPIIFLASGTGFGPIKAMIEYAAKRKMSEARPMTLYWGCRAKQDLYMLDLAQGWAKDVPHFAFVPVLSEPAADDDWTGRTGFVHRAVIEDFPDLARHQVYACGAPVMVEAARRDFTGDAKLPAEEFFADSFLTEAELKPA